MNHFLKTFFSHVFLIGNLFCPNCLTFCYSFRIFSNFNFFFLFALNVAAYWNHLSKSLNHYLNHYFPYWWNLLFFCFLSNQENLHMIYHVYNLLFAYQKINTRKDKIITFPWYFQPNLISRKKWLKNFIYISILFIINYQLYVITSCYQCITCSSSLSLVDIKLSSVLCYQFLNAILALHVCP